MKTKSLSVFDLDHTLCKTNMSFAFGRYLYSQGVMGFSALWRTVLAYGRHKGFGKSLPWLHRQVFSIYLKRVHKPTLLAHVRAFLDQSFQDLLYQPAFKSLEEARNRDEILALFSSSPDFLVEEIARRLKIPFWIGTCYAVDKEEKLCHIACIVDGDYKAEFLGRLMVSQGLDQKNVTVYSDSILDMPLFERAGTKVCVNADRKLSSLCRRNNWKTL